MEAQWHYSRDGKKHAPLSSAALLEMAKKGELLPTDLLWKEGMKNPRPAGDFPKLFAPGGGPSSQMQQRDSPPSGTASVGLSSHESSATSAAGATRERATVSSDPPSAEPSSLKGLTMALGIEPAKPGHDPLLGCDIGGVTIVRLIAEGGMGRVYEGKQEKPGRTVAVKVMRPGLTSPSILKRFEYEAEVLGRLQHPGIAHIYSVGVHRIGNASVPYFIMEYIADARTVTQYAHDLRLPSRHRLDLFRSVCDAVAHGHQKGVIHRDLKPSNILVNGSGQPKVIDFGVARATDSDMALTTMQTDVGQLLGTLQYMSPEQFKADPKDIDVRSDVYALGVILYELLAGKMPYDVRKKAIHEIARIVQEDDPTPLSAINRALKGDVALIAGKCLAKDRNHRYSSASELSSDIERHLTGEPISATRPGVVHGLLRLARKHRAVTLATLGVLLAFVVAFIGIVLFALESQAQQRRTERVLALAIRMLRAPASSSTPTKGAVADQQMSPLDLLRLSRQVVEEAKDPPARAVLMHAIGESMLEMGEYREAVDAAGYSYRSWLSIRGENSDETLTSLALLTTSLLCREDSQERHAAESHAVRLSSNCERRYGPVHPKTIDAKLLLARALRHTGKSTQAESVIAETLRKSTDLNGRDHRLTLLALNARGVAYASRHSWKEAIDAHRTAYETALARFGPSDRDALQFGHNYGVVCLRAAEGQTAGIALREAERLRRMGIKALSEVCQERQQTLGSAHSESMASLYELGKAHLACREADSAVAILAPCQDVLERRARAGDNIAAETLITLKQAQKMQKQEQTPQDESSGQAKNLPEPKS